MDITILYAAIGFTLLLFIFIALLKIKKQFDELLLINRTANIKLDAQVKLLNLSLKALGSIFRATNKKK